VSNDALPLLTSSAWSAVIHRPADEDSEPDDLPSTVDMDAIKVSSGTVGHLLNLHALENTKQVGSSGDTCDLYLKDAWLRTWLLQQMSGLYLRL
jgi:hypothetical protein